MRELVVSAPAGVINLHLRPLHAVAFRSCPTNVIHMFIRLHFICF